ncbi:hemerythrin domain-containing protein [Hoeflea poritis]|uniref:Hemerythrin domain-containing protein n=1 Tax=Hoeflea poritis TaxID=2993659 RepID=A0ABT4VIT3_9HYPH|nr:hemerythrin domain-containing protein [Hoeflea poritis]MDA4844619.1 hemerythrin domain-containing protein [Hoeflea poritis]
MHQPAALELIDESARFFSAPDGDPLEALEKAHLTQLALCDMLEQIADSIPGQINRQTCSRLADKLLPLIRDIHSYEEETLYPRAMKSLGGAPELETTITRLKFEHCEDECFAEELADALHELATANAPKNPEATGYMLRGFFEALRRHIAFEHEHLVRMLRHAAMEERIGLVTG